MVRKFRPNVEVLEGRTLPATNLGLYALTAPPPPTQIHVQHNQQVLLVQQIVSLAKSVLSVPASEPAPSWVDKLGGLTRNHNQTFVRRGRRRKAGDHR